MLSKNVFLMVAIMGVSFSAAPAFSIPIWSESSEMLEIAQNRPNPRNEQMKKGGFMERLNLTESQRSQIEAIQAKRKTEMTQINTQLKTKQDELRTMMNGNASDQQLRSKHTEIVKLRQQLGNLNFENMLEIRAVLTPQQRNQMGQMMMGYRGGNRPNR
jgi:Spy/CpxP family protein refolding chaperone